MTEPGIRSFVAATIPGAITALGKYTAALRPFGGDAVRWVPQENLHVTIRFLGDVEPARVASVEEAIRTTVKGQEAIPVRLQGLGAFPSPGKPRVIWCGMSHGGAQLTEIAGTLEKALQRLGFPPEKRFHPHVTLARVKPRARPAPLALETWPSPPVLDLVIDELVLMKSTLLPRGSEYTPLARFPLAGGTSQVGESLGR